jgi:hypothetical protein
MGSSRLTSKFAKDERVWVIEYKIMGTVKTVSFFASPSDSYFYYHVSFDEAVKGLRGETIVGVGMRKDIEFIAYDIVSSKLWKVLE